MQTSLSLSCKGALPPERDAYMNETITEIKRLLQEVVEHLKAGTTADTRKAVTKLERIATQASTLAQTIQAARR